MKLVLENNKMMSLALAFVAVYAVMLLPTAAMAAPSGLTNVLCEVIAWFTGTLGTALATIAIIVIGIGALMGKVSWGMAIIVGLGVGVIFGATSIATALGGTGGC